MAAATDSVSRSLSPPWAHVVRGEPQSDSAPQSQHCSSSTAVNPTPPPLSSEDSAGTNVPGDGGLSAAMKPLAWNKPANGAVQEVGPVMGAVSWPALSDSARPLPRSSLDQGPLVASAPNEQPTTTSSSIAAAANPNSIPNNAFPLRHKSTKRGGGGGRPPPQIAPTVEVPPPPTLPPRNDSANSGTTASPSPSSRRGNGRREHDRANHEWSRHRNFNGRDVHLQQQQHCKPFPFPRSFARHPPPTIPPFIPHPPPPLPPARQFGNTIGFHGVTTPVYYARPLSHKSIRGVPFIHAPPPPPIFFPAPNPQLLVSLLKQIDYYFSHDNLCKDIFLRQRMDDQGWVPVSLIATFNRVRQLTNNTRIILEAVRASTVVEVKGDKIRRRNDWKNWLLPPSTNQSTLSAPHPPHIAHNDMLATHLQNVRLEERDIIQNTILPTKSPMRAVTSKPSSVDLNGQSQTFIIDGTVPSVVQECSDQSMSPGDSCKS